MFRRLWVRDYFLGGGAYAYIERDIYGMPAALYYVDESRLSTIPNCKAIFKDYSVSVDGSIYPKSDFLKILRNSRGNGKGAGIVSESGTILATAYNTMLYENSIVKKGGNKRGFFTSQNQQTKEAMQAIKEAWGKMYSTSQGVEDNVAVLNAGMDFKEVSLSSMDMQLNQNKQTNSGEVCGIFGVPPSMMSGTASPEAKENFITDTLTPFLNIFETAFDSDLLLEAEKGRRYFAFDTRELTRGDILKRYQAYAIGKKNGFLLIDDIREQEDLTPIDFPFIQLNLSDVLYNPETKEIYTPNTDAIVNLKGSGRKLVGDGTSPEEISDSFEELRFNPNHDPTNGQFTSNPFTSGNFSSSAIRFSGGGASKGLTNGGGNAFSGVDKSIKSDIIKESIKNGSIKLEINHEKQARHMQETHIKGRSYLTVSETEAQEIVNHKSGTGTLILNKDGVPSKERINAEKIIGVNVEKSTGAETSTDKATIHYSKTGTHLVPRRGEKNHV
ncbi:MAG: phage portal protein [Oscillospiraceae bacterium]|nr:phage portal protein [Oscillospiraceae bacterium]